MPFISGAAALLALQLGMPAAQSETPSLIQVQYCGHGYDIDIGASRRHGQYRLQHDSVAFFGPRGVFLAGKVFGDTLDLHVVAISREDASQDVAIRFVRSN